ncbi:Tafazzin-like Acyltransferase [Leptotrombidium deliense]|uniref:Tafazzin family protein n=1 Tax=Leptotrombidium deliense TaxID=299467 RepID=A0A443SR51_9ACAR|nr:Tafazzin-like Acyltransferase [Leptotrombidium deliense]
MNEKFMWPENLLPLRKPLQNLKYAWRVGSAIVVPAVAMLSKIWMTKFNTTNVHNYNVFLDTISRHYANRHALITISNHNSCLDDPYLYSALFPWKWIFNSDIHRWSSAAEDICFTRNWHTLFFTLGKTFPVVRGKGIYQSGMDFAVELLKGKQLLHVFPQGKVIEDEQSSDPRATNSSVNEMTLSSSDSNKTYDFKWGLARLILDTIGFDELNNDSLEVLPFYHIGMNKVLPNVKPYIPKFGNRVTICFRDSPIVFNRNFIVNELCGGSLLSVKQRRVAISRYLEMEMRKLKLETMKRHYK